MSDINQNPDQDPMRRPDRIKEPNQNPDQAKPGQGEPNQPGQPKDPERSPGVEQG